MTFRGILIAIAVLLSLQIVNAHAAGEWRTRACAEDRDIYLETDVNEEINFGREIAARILGQYKMSSDKKLQKYLNLVGTSLTRNCSRSELDFHFVLLDSSELNAYSTPGGYVFVTSALLSHMENEAELAGVLAHEISHVTERHIVKELNLRGAEHSPISSISALLGGASGSVKIAFSQVVDKAVDLILRDGYKQEDEMKADTSAVILSAFAGYDPSGLVSFLEKVGKVKTDVGKTYPVYDLRLATIEKTIAANGIDGANMALNTERFISATTKGAKVK